MDHIFLYGIVGQQCKNYKIIYEKMILTLLFFLSSYAIIIMSQVFFRDDKTGQDEMENPT